jgi:hypothetical protein
VPSYADSKALAMVSNSLADLSDIAMMSSRAPHMPALVVDLSESTSGSREQSTPPYQLRHTQAALQNGSRIVQFCTIFLELSVKTHVPWPEQMVPSKAL